MPKLIIGVTGRAGAGKDTVCDLGVELHHPAVHLALSDPLKALCANLFCDKLGVPRSAFYGTQDQKNAELSQLEPRSSPGDLKLTAWTGRGLLQYIGTECFRSIDPDIWVRLTLKQAQDWLDSQASATKTAIVFINGVRFNSEADAIRDAGGIILRVERPETPEGLRTNQGIPGHASEVEMASIKADYMINNQNRSLLELKEHVRSLLGKLI